MVERTTLGTADDPELRTDPDGGALAQVAATRQGGGLASWWRARRTAATERRERQRRAWRLYAAAVACARERSLFATLGVPDTPDGRFEMVAAHVAILFGRLRREGGAAARLGDALVEAMVSDMDRSVRELGVGDLSVGRYVKRMAASFQARWRTLDAALPARDTGAIATMLDRNLPRDGAGEPHLEAVATRLLAFADALDQAPTGALLMGILPPMPAGRT